MTNAAYSSREEGGKIDAIVFGILESGQVTLAHLAVDAQRLGVHGGLPMQPGPLKCQLGAGVDGEGITQYTDGRLDRPTLIGILQPRERKYGLLRSYRGCVSGWSQIDPTRWRLTAPCKPQGAPAWLLA